MTIIKNIYHDEKKGICQISYFFRPVKGEQEKHIELYKRKQKSNNANIGCGKLVGIYHAGCGYNSMNDITYGYIYISEVSKGYSNTKRENIDDISPTEDGH